MNSNQKNKGFGVIYGRFQPFHKGHKAIVDQIIKDGLTPVVLFGSSNQPISEKNPYNVTQRARMVKSCYPDTTILGFPLEDKESDTEWFNSILSLLKTNVTNDMSKFTFYSFNKEEDRSDFNIRGIPFMNSFYSNAFSLNGFKTKELTGSFDIPIRATKIRNDLEKHKDFLEPEVYAYIKKIKIKLKD